MKTTIAEIHGSLVNGQRKQMVSQIDEYGTYDFFSDYKEFLGDVYGYNGRNIMLEYFTNATISYFRIKER